MSSDTTDILLQVLAAFVVARALGSLATALRLPSVIGELLAGALLGPHLLDVVRHTEFLDALAELGVIFLLFQAGLETRTQELFVVRNAAIRVGFLGVAFPFALGYLTAAALGFPAVESLFVATALVATSVGITIRVLRDLGFERRRSARIILAAAVLDDVLGLILLVLVKDIASGSTNLLELLVLAVEAAGFVGFAVVLGPRLAARATAVARRLGVNLLFEISIAVMLALSLLAERIGLAAIIGAFLAGLMLSELEDYGPVERRFDGLAVFFVPFFFVLMGSFIDFRAFGDASIVLAMLALTVVAVVSKYAGGALGAAGEGRRTANEVGVGMVPRGEVGIVVAGIALSAQMVGDDVYTAVVGMVVLTTFVAPFLIRWVYGGSDPGIGEPADAVNR
jgi:Kef-type K+ transport system membrane component KefB